MRSALFRGNLAAVAEVLNRGWDHKKRSADGVTTSHIEEIDAVARKAGARAGKVSDAGGGGFMMFNVDPADRNRIVVALSPFKGRCESLQEERATSQNESAICCRLAKRARGQMYANT